MSVNILFNCLVASNALIYCDYALRFVPKTVTAKFLGTSAYVGFGHPYFSLRSPWKNRCKVQSISVENTKPSRGIYRASLRTCLHLEKKL